MSDDTENTASNETVTEAVANDTASPSHIICDEMLDISVASELRTQLLQALEVGQAITLDGSAIERADTAALQVLTAFFQDAKTRDIPVQWSSSSEALTRSAALLGITDILDLNASGS